MRALIQYATPDTWPEGWAFWPVTRRAILTLASDFIGTIVQPADVGTGRGIVTSAGPGHFPSLYVMLRRLRELGCALPVEVWHMNELDPAMCRVLAGLGAEVVNASALRGAIPVRILRGWELKPYAVINSRFAEVLWIDADSIPVRDPAALFDSSQYADRGAIFFPDYPHWTLTADNWRAFGLMYTGGPNPYASVHDRESFGKPIPEDFDVSWESGQFVVNKRRVWSELRLAGWWAEHSDYTFRHVHGDKECFHIAWRMLNTSPAIPRTFPGYDLHTMLQYGFDGEVWFGHRTQAKFVYGEFQPFAINHQPDDRHLHELAAEQLKHWSGKPWDNTTHRTGIETAVARGLCQKPWTYRRVGHDERPMAFAPDGTISEGAAGLERRWAVFMCDGRPLLVVTNGAGVVTFTAEPDRFGDWRGRWASYEQMPVELVARTAAATCGVASLAGGRAHRAGTWDSEIWRCVYTENEYKIPGGLIQPGDVVIDCGGHTGAFSVLCAERGATVEAYEANIENAALLAHNATGFPVTVHNAAIWNAATDLVWRGSTNPVNTGGGGVASTGDGQPVRGVALSAVLNRFPLVRVLKLDIEGAEFDALEEAGAALTRCSLIVGEYHLDGDSRTIERLKDALQRWGFVVAVVAATAELGHFWATGTRA